MNLTDKLSNILTKLNTALDDINTALVASGGRRAYDICDVSDKITNIYDWTFQKVISRELGNFTVTLPQGDKNSLCNSYDIGDYAFYGCKGLASITIPGKVSNSGGVRAIGNQAFYNCTGLTSITIPDSVTSIGSCFENCTGLTSITFPEGVDLAAQCFENCTGLNEVTFLGLPSGIVGATAFKDCTNLTTINVPWSEDEVSWAPWGATNATINYNYTGG